MPKAASGVPRKPSSRGASVIGPSLSLTPQRVTIWRAKSVPRWGMSDALGPITLAPRDDGFLGTPEAAFGMGQRPYSEATAQAVDAEVERILQEGYQLS